MSQLYDAQTIGRDPCELYEEKIMAEQIVKTLCETVQSLLDYIGDHPVDDPVVADAKKTLQIFKP